MPKTTVPKEAIKEKKAFNFSELFSSIFGIKKHKSAVLIPSRMGLPSAKICSVVLVDTGCNTQGCITDGINPCNLDVGCPSDTILSFRDPSKKNQPESSDDSVASVVVKNVSQTFKTSLLEMKGIVDINFGKAVVEKDEIDATKVDFSIEIDFPTILKTYVSCCDDCVVYCGQKERDSLERAIQSAGFNMPVVVFSGFHN